MEINLEYFNGELSDKMSSVSAKLQGLLAKFGTISIPKGVDGTAAPDCAAGIQRVHDALQNANKAVGDASNKITELVQGFQWAENYAMGVAVTLSEGVKYTENSKGEGRSNTVRSDNIYATPDDEYIVKYIAIYADGKYKYNMILDESNKGQSIDTIIAKLKEEGEISEDAQITLSQGVTKEQEDGTLGDIGWLPQVTYKPGNGTANNTTNNN